MKGDFRYKKAIKLAKLKNNEKVLDAGGSKGILLNYINKNIDYTSIDYNKTINEHFTDYPIPKNYKHFNCDLTKGLPKELENKKFDVIFILDVLEYLENYKSFLIECKNHLTSNGRIIMTIPTNFRYVKHHEKNVYHTFKKSNLINLANFLDMNYFITGIHIRIPKFNIFIPSSQLIYNETFLIKLKLKQKPINRILKPH